MSKVLHNPKAYSPALYIPCWLSQVPHKELSFGAKLLYGRLAQWSSTTGEVYRSSPKLSKELGIGVRTIEKFIKELKDCGLIGTYHPQAGGSNHFEFYDHEWMHRLLVDELGYEHNKPPNNRGVPPEQPCGTPPNNRADINKKEIKEIKEPPISPKGDEQLIAAPERETPFSMFWKEWPIKADKKKAQEIWKRKKLDSDAIKIIAKVKEKKEHDDRWKEGFIPKATTFLNGEKWEDEIFRRPSSEKLRPKTSVTPDERMLINNYCSQCKCGREPNEELRKSIELMKDKLKKTDTSEAREAVAAINNAEEALIGRGYKKLIETAAKNHLHQPSPIALENLKALRMMKGRQ